MWSMPRKPQRKPKPSASEDSGSNVKLESIEGQFLQGGSQVVELIIGGRKQAAKDYRHRLFVSRESLLGRPGRLCDRVADSDIREPLDVGDDVADLPHPQLLASHLPRSEPAQACDFVFGTLRHERDLLPNAQRSIDHAHVGDDPLVVIKLGIEDQGP